MDPFRNFQALDQMTSVDLRMMLLKPILLTNVQSNLDWSPGNVLVGVEGELVQVTHQDTQLLLVVRAIQLLPKLLNLNVVN